ncbi:TetR/AcrR family transcriptional regulator [Oceanicaulis sp. MMSF_3324]|uniref:TetR/AcrR family transcriptional regulator n=1 Tax=Oceanicaulis sp. MMSF_3324 TaxID=3046702 RepID=UPI00273EA900|nr:TetR/AcrR family transcriptional regulator [Oceanicaulis sp. MMSF_3324]
MSAPDLKSRLIAAAHAMIRSGERGSLSLRAVARKAGVSEAAPYTWFKGKSELMAHVATLGFETLNIRLAASANEPDAIDTLCAMGRAYLDFAEAEPALYALMFSDDADLDRTLPRYQDASAACFERLSLAASRCAHAEPQSETGQKAALAAWSLVHGLAQLPLRRPTDAVSRADTAHWSMRALAEGLSRV